MKNPLQPNKLTDIELYELFGKNALPFGRMISGSKSGYYNRYPTHFVIFNANIVTEEQGKIWYGDVDIDVDEKNLKAVAEIIGEFYILREMDGRFENEDKPSKDLIKKAVVRVTKDEITQLART